MEPLIITKLKDTLLDKQMRNPQYSLRSFARDLDLSSGKLSEILRCKTKLTVKSFENLSEKINLTDQDYFLMKRDLEDFNEGRRLIKNLEKEKVVSDMDFALTHEHLVLMALINLPLFKEDMSWVSQVLGIKTDKLETLLSDLLRVNLVYRDENKKLKTAHTGGRINPPTTEQIIAFLKNSVDRVKTKIDKYEDPHHWFTSMVIPAPKSEIKLLRKKFWQLLKEINFDQEKNLSKSDEIYEILIGVTPVTKLNAE